MLLPHPKTFLFISLTGFLLAWSASAPGQSRVPDKARNARAEVLPQAPPPTSPKEEDESADAPAPDATPLGVDLHAIRLIPHQDQADSGSTPGSDPIVIEPGILAPAGLDVELRPYLGKPLSMALLADLAKAIIHAWRDEDFPIVDVYFPEQNITGGRVQIVVREALLGKVVINDVVHSDPAYLESNIRLAPGDRIDRRILEADLDWLNRNPIRQVNLIYDKGESDGTSEITLDTVEEDPLTAYIGIANTGVASTGENEWSAGFNWADRKSVV